MRITREENAHLFLTRKMWMIFWKSQCQNHDSFTLEMVSFLIRIPMIIYMLKMLCLSQEERAWFHFWIFFKGFLKKKKISRWKQFCWTQILICMICFINKSLSSTSRILISNMCSILPKKILIDTSTKELIKRSFDRLCYS